jgi:single-strand DNA-binding protein
MNTFSLLIASSHTTALTRNQDGTCTFQAEIWPTRDNNPPIRLLVKAWGKLAESVADQFPLQRDVVATGSIHIPKFTPGDPNRPLELHLTSFDPCPFSPIALVGRAGRDPEARFFDSGAVVAELTLAVRRTRDDTDWFNLKIWGKQAQVALDYVRKGALIGVTGSFATESWADKATGEIRCKPLVQVDRLDLLGSRRDSEAHGAHGAEASKPAASGSWTPPSAGGWAPPSGGAL